MRRWQVDVQVVGMVSIVCRDKIILGSGFATLSRQPHAAWGYADFDCLRSFEWSRFVNIPGMGWVMHHIYLYDSVSFHNFSM